MSVQNIDDLELVKIVDKVLTCDLFMVNSRNKNTVIRRFLMVQKYLSVVMGILIVEINSKKVHNDQNNDVQDNK